MKKRIVSILCTCCMVIGLTAGCGASGSGNETNTQTSAKTESSSEAKASDETQVPGETAKGSEAAETTADSKDSVVVTMPTTSEPESGFDPAYGWGAGEHVHEPLIQSTLTVTTTDLKIDKDLATDYSASEDGMTWTVKIRDDVKFHLPIIM